MLRTAVIRNGNTSVAAPANSGSVTEPANTRLGPATVTSTLALAAVRGLSLANAALVAASKFLEVGLGGVAISVAVSTTSTPLNWAVRLRGAWVKKRTPTLDSPNENVLPAGPLDTCLFHDGIKATSAAVKNGGSPSTKYTLLVSTCGVLGVCEIATP